jgi:hypothetical protein
MNQNEKIKGLRDLENMERDASHILSSLEDTLGEYTREGKYKLPFPFSEQFIDSINRVNQELKEIREKRLTIKKDLSGMKNKTVHSYMEMAEVSDFLSTMNLKRHKELQDKALKWLFSAWFYCGSGFTLWKKS